MTNSNIKGLQLIVGASVSITVYFLMRYFELEYAPSATAALTLLTAWWWATEALPVPATSLIPFAGFPLLGIFSHKEAATGLGSHIILLLMGGFLMAKALERVGAHKHFAFMILHAIGKGSNKKLVLAFIMAGALPSMWISNTATCLMLMPIALASLHQIGNDKMKVPLILAVAYGCSIGGMATLIGTPPNVIYSGIYEEAIGKEYGFMQWLKIGLPVVILCLPITWVWLVRNVSGQCESTLLPMQKWDVDQKRVITIFSMIVLMWIFRSEPMGGWTGLMSLSGVGDSTIALFGAVLMFLVRSEKGGGLLDWKYAVNIPWGVLLMFGAGITIATAFFQSGLAELIGSSLTGFFGNTPLFILILVVCLAVIFITEINSNVATTTLVIPILASAALSAQIPPEILMIPATLAASCAFMLPVATAPNAIAYSTEEITIDQMMREGFGLNILLVFVISISCYFLLG